VYGTSKTRRLNCGASKSLTAASSGRQPQTTEEIHACGSMLLYFSCVQALHYAGNDSTILDIPLLRCEQFCATSVR